MTVSRVESLFEVLKIWGSGTIYTDISKRVATCRICGEAIPKKTRRVAHFTRCTNPRTFPNGGRITKRVEYYHPECIAARFMTADVIPRFRRGHCADCGEALPLSAENDTYYGRVRAVMSSRAAMASLCYRCAESPRWRKCEACGLSYPRYQVSRLADGQVTGSFVTMRAQPIAFACQHCVRDEGYTTRASVLRKVRIQERMDDRYQRIRNELAEHGL